MDLLPLPCHYKTAARLLSYKNFQTLAFLGVNRNVKSEWRTIHRAFGGIGSFSVAVEHTIDMINIFIQHYGSETTLARKFLASIEALQLEIGCVGNQLETDNDHFHILATPCWMKSFWECLYFYPFRFMLTILV
jgi:hypothetical protein